MTNKGKKGASASEAVPPELSGVNTIQVPARLPAPPIPPADRRVRPYPGEGSRTVEFDSGQVAAAYEAAAQPASTSVADEAATSRIQDSEQARTRPVLRTPPGLQPQANALPALGQPAGTLGGMDTPTKGMPPVVDEGSRLVASPAASRSTVRAQAVPEYRTEEMAAGHAVGSGDVRETWWEGGTPMATPVQITSHNGVSVAKWYSRPVAFAMLAALTLIVIGTIAGLIAGGHGGKQRRWSAPKALLSPMVGETNREPVRESVGETIPSVHANDPVKVPPKPARPVKRAKPPSKTVSIPTVSNAVVVLSPDNEGAPLQVLPCWAEAVRLMRAGQQEEAKAEMSAALKRGCNISREWREAVLDARADKK